MVLKNCRRTTHLWGQRKSKAEKKEEKKEERAAKGNKFCKIKQKVGKGENH